MTRAGTALLLVLFCGCREGQPHGLGPMVDPIVGAWNAPDASSRVYFHQPGPQLDSNGRGWGETWSRDEDGGLTIGERPVTETLDAGQLTLCWTDGQPGADAGADGGPPNGLDDAGCITLTRADQYLVLDQPDAGGFEDACTSVLEPPGG